MGRGPKVTRATPISSSSGSDGMRSPATTLIGGSISLTRLAIVYLASVPMSGMNTQSAPASLYALQRRTAWRNRSVGVPSATR